VPTALNSASLSIIQLQICTTIWSSACKNDISTKEAYANRTKNLRALIDHSSGGGQHFDWKKYCILIVKSNPV
jgi:hypothetical protein